MGLNLFLRNLAKCGKTVTLQNRDIQVPDFGSPDFDEAFSGDTDVQAIINTQRGKVLFDGVATDNPITHKICIKYLPGITSETWILYEGRRFDILDIENCGEQDKCLVLRCTERGVGEAAKV
jgi:hypothetical protein